MGKSSKWYNEYKEKNGISYSTKHNRDNPEAKRKSDKLYRERHKEAIAQKDREYYLANREKIISQCNAYAVGYNQQKRNSAIDVLGGKCVRCGIDDRRVLQIDHINGGGKKEERKIGNGGIVKKILTEGTAGYQLLCANCNWIKRWELKEDGSGVRRRNDKCKEQLATPILEGSCQEQ